MRQMTKDAADKTISPAPAGDNSSIQATAKGDDPGGDLSRFVFSNPQQFLETLNKDVERISRSSRIISAEDLEKFAADPKNPLPERAAAEIAANHYDQLVYMASVPWGDGLFNKQTADTLLNLENGSTSALKAELATANTVGVVATAGVAVILGGITAVGAEVFPPAAVASGVGTVAMAGLSVEIWSHLRGDSAAVDSLAGYDKNIFAGWKEINGQNR
jgi:hypothetical protein